MPLTPFGVQALSDRLKLHAFELVNGGANASQLRDDLNEAAGHLADLLRAEAAPRDVEIKDRICPWCGDRLIVLKSSHGCLIGEKHGYVWHAACVEALEQREEDRAALLQQIAQLTKRVEWLQARLPHESRSSET